MIAALRRLLLVTLSLLLALVAAVVLATQVPAVRAYILHRMESRLTQYVGRDIRVGQVSVRPLQAGLVVHGLRVSSGSGPSAGTLLAVDTIRVGWSWKGLLRRHLSLNRILLVRPRLTLGSIETAVPATGWLARLLRTGPFVTGGWMVDVPRLDIEAGSATWETNGTTGRVEGVHGFLERRGHEGEASLVATIRASRLVAPLGGSLRDVAGLTLQIDGTAKVLTITTADGVVEGTRVTGKGRILDPAGVGELDLDLTVSSPLTALLRRAGVATEVDGHLEAEGTIRGPWARAVFQGKGRLQLSKASRARVPLVFDLRWADGRLEAETPGAAQPNALWAGLLLAPATGEYRVRLKARDADLGRLTGLPAVLAQLVGFTLPADVGGRLTADADLAGRGTNLATLRGHGALRVNPLSVAAGLPTGRLEARVRATASRLTLETFALDVPGGTVQGSGSVVFAGGRVDVPIQASIRSVAALGRGFGLPALGGTATLGGRLTGTLDAPRFQGHLSWRQPRVAVYDADLIDGDVEWQPRALRSSRLLVRLGQTVITVQGSAVARGITPLRRLDPKRDLALDLGVRVSPGRTADLAPFLPAPLPVRGAFRARGRITGTPQEPIGEVDVAFDDVQTWDEQWQRGSALLRLTPSAVEITRLALGRGDEQASGTIRIGRDGALTGQVSTTAMDLAKIGVLSRSQIAGRAGFVLDVRGALQEPRVLGKATVAALRFRAIPCGPGVATFTIDRNTIDMDLALREGSQRLRLTLDPPPDRALHAELALSDADLDPLLRLTTIDARGASHARGSGRILMSGRGADFANTAGEATLDALRFQWKNETWENRGPLELAWRGRTVTLRQVRLQARGVEIDIRGSAAAGDKTDLRVQARFPLAAIPGYLPLLQRAAGLGTADLHVRGAWRAPEIHGTVQVKDGEATLEGLGAPLEEVQGTVEFSGERALIRGLQARIAGGSAQATGEAAWHGEEWSGQITFEEAGARVEQLLGGSSSGTGEVTGTLSLGGTLASRGRTVGGLRSNLLSNLGGDLKLAMAGGQLGPQTLMVRVLSLISLGGLFDAKTLGAFSRGMPYQRLAGDIAIHRGVARTENLLLESRAFNLSAHGDVDLVNEAIEMDVAVKPFQTVNRVVTKVPVVGWLLSGKNGAVIAAFYRVSGPLGHPTVTSLPVSSIGRNVFGVFRRLLQFPEEVTGP
jgi:hypothetical protein